MVGASESLIHTPITDAAARCAETGSREMPDHSAPSAGTAQTPEDLARNIRRLVSRLRLNPVYANDPLEELGQRSIADFLTTHLSSELSAIIQMCRPTSGATDALIPNEAAEALLLGTISTIQELLHGARFYHRPTQDETLVEALLIASGTLMPRGLVYPASYFIQISCPDIVQSQDETVDIMADGTVQEEDLPIAPKSNHGEDLQCESREEWLPLQQLTSLDKENLATRALAETLMTLGVNVYSNRNVTYATSEGSSQMESLFDEKPDVERLLIQIGDFSYQLTCRTPDYVLSTWEVMQQEESPTGELDTLSNDSSRTQFREFGVLQLLQAIKSMIDAHTEEEEIATPLLPNEQGATIRGADALTKILQREGETSLQVRLEKAGATLFAVPDSNIADLKEHHEVHIRYPHFDCVITRDKNSSVLRQDKQGEWHTPSWRIQIICDEECAFNLHDQSTISVANLEPCLNRFLDEIEIQERALGTSIKEWCYDQPAPRGIVNWLRSGLLRLLRVSS